MVVLGSPHFSLAEFKQLAPLVAGKHTHPRVKFLVTSSRAMTLLARQSGDLQRVGSVRRAGDGRYVHPRLADAAAGDQNADDQFGQVRRTMRRGC